MIGYLFIGFALALFFAVVINKHKIMFDTMLDEEGMGQRFYYFLYALLVLAWPVILIYLIFETAKNNS